ncbi:MAG: septum formation initiator family protein [Clostridia bacterium]|jgi:cell division protein FtsL|nr:septum formation initiator family protein [Clostridia bacterium]
MKKRTKLIFIVLIVYATITIINQQKTLNSYKTTQADLDEQIEEAKNYQEELNISKQNINSLEYVEKVARKKLNMYYPNERIYVDSNK